MTDRRDYLAAAIRLYLKQPGAPRRASRPDWAVATTLYNRGVPLETLAHVFRLATLRRARPGPALEPVHSLAYYRRVLEQLTPEALDPGYVDYVERRYQALVRSPAEQPSRGAVSGNQHRAGLGRR